MKAIIDIERPCFDVCTRSIIKLFVMLTLQLMKIEVKLIIIVVSLTVTLCTSFFINFSCRVLKDSK